MCFAYASVLRTSLAVVYPTVVWNTNRSPVPSTATCWPCALFLPSYLACNKQGTSGSGQVLSCALLQTLCTNHHGRYCRILHTPRPFHLLKLAARANRLLLVPFLATCHVPETPPRGIPVCRHYRPTDGIGKSLAKILYAKGFNLILHGRNEEKIKKVVEEIQALHSRKDGEIKYFVADASESGHDFESIAKRYEDLNITLFINNVGGSALILKTCVTVCLHPRSYSCSHQ